MTANLLRYLLGSLVMVLLLEAISPAVSVHAQGVASSNPGTFTLGRLKYEGGGDWYSDPLSLRELIQFVQANTRLPIADQEVIVDLDQDRLFAFPVVYLTGHGNVRFSPSNVRRLRAYLEQGGFLHIDDNYGLDAHIRREMRKVYPNQEFVELPFSHPIYHSHFSFPEGLPKVHEHDGNPPQGFGLFNSAGELVVFYSYEADLGDGWEPKEVHDNPDAVREAALKMGTNILVYAFMRPKDANS